MSAATEQQNNGDVAVEKIAADTVKDDLKSQKAVIEDSKSAATDNGTASKDEVHDDDTSPAKENVKGTKRPADVKNSDSNSKKAKNERRAIVDEEDLDDDDEILEEYGNEDSDESDDYDIPYDGEDDLPCEEEDDDIDDGSGSDDQA